MSSLPTPADTPDAGCRPMRADARRNRERVLEAARTAFAEQGVETQIDDVAARAGVGVGTVYRHFPTKEALMEALAVERFRALAELAHRALETDDPWEAFSGFMWRAAELQAADRALAEAMAAHPGIMREAATSKSALHEAVGRLVERSKAAGVLRPDVVTDDVPTLMCGLARAQGMGDEGSPVSWRRYLAIVLDGLRATDAEPLPGS